ncbi:hypothetical protein D3C83_297820 [compost metagenome]
MQPGGTVTVNADGTFSVTVSLEARRNGTDRDGRRYELVVTAVDNEGNTATASATTVVSHDRRK